MATAHIGASKEDIAEIVLMPGDPLRAKYIAETFLEDAQLYNEIRGMYGYTGFYQGKRISVQGSGMGIPSIGIYSYELFNFYDVKRIIRVGTMGSYQEDLKIGDIVIAQGASTDSNYGMQFGMPGNIAPLASFEMLEKAVSVVRKYGYHFGVGNVLSSDVFYNADGEVNGKWAKMGVIGVEMETAALYLNAMYSGNQALGIFTVSDEIYSGKVTSAQERQESFTNMMRVALETAGACLS